MLLTIQFEIPEILNKATQLNDVLKAYSIRVDTKEKESLFEKVLHACLDQDAIDERVKQSADDLIVPKDNPHFKQLLIHLFKSETKSKSTG